MADVVYTKGYKYRLEEAVEIYLPDTMRCLFDWDSRYTEMHDGVLHIYEGYAWDGMSGPVPDLSCTMEASLWHDACYQALRSGAIPPYYRRRIDKHFGYLLRKNGVPKWLSDLAVKVVQKKGEVYATTPRKTYTA